MKETLTQKTKELEIVSIIPKIEVLSRSIFLMKTFKCKNCGSGAIRAKYEKVLLKNRAGDYEVEKRNITYFCNKCKIENSEILFIVESSYPL